MSTVTKGTGKWTSDQLFFVLSPILFGVTALFLMPLVPFTLKEAGLPSNLQWGLYVALSFGAIYFLSLGWITFRDGQRHHGTTNSVFAGEKPAGNPHHFVDRLAIHPAYAGEKPLEK